MGFNAGAFGGSVNASRISNIPVTTATPTDTYTLTYQLSTDTIVWAAGGGGGSFPDIVDTSGVSVHFINNVIVSTANNTLDDGAGNVSIAGQLGGYNLLTVTDSAAVTALVVQDQQNVTASALVKTANNTLDDGSGNITLVGASNSDGNISVYNQISWGTNLGSNGSPYSFAFGSGSGLGCWVKIYAPSGVGDNSTSIALGIAGNQGYGGGGVIYIGDDVSNEMLIRTGHLDVNNTPTFNNTLDDGSGNSTNTGSISPGNNATAGTASHIFSGTGDPNTAVSGVAGDYYFRVDGGTATHIYICTGTTNWTGII